MASPNQPNPYLKARIMTASPTELRLMLYEGAIKFCRVADQGIEQGDLEASYNALLRAQKIVLELSTSLNRDVAPELCDRLSALYTYIYKRLVDASLNRDQQAVREALQLLEYEKETWQLLMKRLAEQGNAADATGAQQTAISSLSARA